MGRILTPKSLIATVGLLLAGNASFAQLVNNGATIKIQPGAFIFCAGDVQNNAGGSISNDGKLEVQGNFTNAATYTTATADDSLIFSGATNSILNTGGSTLTNLWIKKTSAANTVTLGATATVSGKFLFDEGLFTTDPIANPTFLLSAPVSAVFSYAAGKEVVGKVRRTSWANGVANVFNGTNMKVTTNAGTPPTDFTVTMLPGADPTDAEREVKRKFGFSATGGATYTTDISFQYLDGELNTNAEGNLVPWQRIVGTPTEWNSKTFGARDIANNFVTTTGITTAQLGNEWKLADPHYTTNATVILRGPWNGTTMLTGLNSGGTLNSFALSQPYTGAPFNYAGTEAVAAGFFAAHPTVVDWVLVELRKPATGLPADATQNSVNTIIGRKAGFLLSNGTIVDPDGVTPIAFDISKQGASFIVVRHRNHLAIMSNSIASNAAGTFANNFTTALANTYKSASATSDPVTALPSSALFGMWPGNANTNTVVNSLDVTAIKTAISILLTGYQLQDVNMNGSINSLDVTLTKGTISTLGSSSTPARLVHAGGTPTNVNIASHIPD